MSFEDRFRAYQECLLSYLLDVYEPEPPGPPRVIPKEELRVACSPTEVTRGTGYHKHRCGDCGNTWKHSDEIGERDVSEQDFYESHTCDQCGKLQTWKHYCKGEGL